MADFHRRDSFLRNADTFEGFLDLNELPRMPKSVEDQVYVIEARYHERPDLLAFDRYGSSRLWWVFALKNPDIIKDPLNDFKPGVMIKIPSPEIIKNMMG